jgi:hypothetical protein
VFGLMVGAVFIVVIALVVGLAIQGLPITRTQDSGSVSNPALVQHRASERTSTTPLQDQQALVDFRIGEHAMLMPAEERALANQALVDFRAAERTER